MKYILTIIITMILTFSVTTYVFFCIANVSIGERIEFQDKSGDFKFTAIPSKGRDLKMLNRELETYKIKNDISEDIIIYRTTKKNYVNVSNWLRYKYQPEWQVKLLE